MFKSMIKSWFNTAVKAVVNAYSAAKMAVLEAISTVCNKAAVALTTESKAKEETVIVAGTSEVVEEVNATIEEKTATIADVIVVVATAVATYFVVMNLPITILFIMECYFVYRAIKWTINFLSTLSVKA